MSNSINFTTGINTNIITDVEKSFQNRFYEAVFGNNVGCVEVSRNTDGYSPGIAFEHKQNVNNFGLTNALSQLLIYQSKNYFDGYPIPFYGCVVGHLEKTAYVYNLDRFMNYISDHEIYKLLASKGIPNFLSYKPNLTIPFDLDTGEGIKKIRNFCIRNLYNPRYIKVDINAYNAIGWSTYYYDNCKENDQKATKNAFIKELRNPKKTLKDFVNPWTGDEMEFKYIQDALNDIFTKRSLGTYYTPPIYGKLGYTHFYNAIKRAIQYGKNKILVVDRCAGTGNLEDLFFEMFKSKKQVCKNIRRLIKEYNITIEYAISTYEYREWLTLYRKFKNNPYVSMIIPRNIDDIELQNQTERDRMEDANALTKEYYDNFKSYIENDEYAIILWENPPFSTDCAGKIKSVDKSLYVFQEMKKKGCKTYDLLNGFIWSGFNLMLRKPWDSYILIAPIKYWKKDNLVNKPFYGGFVLNRKHFHAKNDYGVTYILWGNEDSTIDTIRLQPYELDMDTEELVKVKDMIVVHKMKKPGFSGINPNTKKISTDTIAGICCNNSGLPVIFDGKNSFYNTNDTDDKILCHMLMTSSNFEQQDLHSFCTTFKKANSTVRNGKGILGGYPVRRGKLQYLLPFYAASNLMDYDKGWMTKGISFMSLDGIQKYNEDYDNGLLDNLILDTLFWYGFSICSHCRSITHPITNEVFINETALDRFTFDVNDYNNTLTLNNVLQETELQKLIVDYVNNKGAIISEDVKVLMKQWDDLMKNVVNTEEYNSSYTYSLYQIDSEINLEIETGAYKINGTPIKCHKYGDINKKISDIKNLVKKFYINNIMPSLYKYNLLHR